MLPKQLLHKFAMIEKKKASVEGNGCHDMDSASNASYDSLPMQDFNEQEVSFLGPMRQKKTKSRKGIILLWLANALLFSTSIGLVIYFALRMPSEAQCDRVLSPYSPALVAVEYETYHFQNNFTQPSIYRGPPTPETEAAWEELTHAPAVNVPMDKLHLLNKSTEVDWVRSPEEAGGGAAALLEVVHQLHCLSLLRKWSYREWYEEAPLEFDGSKDLMWEHIDHCIEILRVHLMCASDVTPFLAIRDENSPIGERADFESMHKCRNFSKLKDWMWNNMAMP